MQKHTGGLFDVAAKAEAALRGSESSNVLSQLASDGQSRIVGWNLARGSGERKVVHVQEENLSADGMLVLCSSGNGAQTIVL